MELYDVMRTTFACREFTGEPVPQDVLHRIIDHARFAPRGGNHHAPGQTTQTVDQIEAQVGRGSPLDQQPGQRQRV